MGVQSQSALIGALILLGLSVNVLFERRRVEHRAAFAALMCGLAFYNLASFFYWITDTSFWFRLLLLSGVVVAQVCLPFFERVLERRLSPTRKITHISSVIILFLLPFDIALDPIFGTAVALLGLGVYGLCIWGIFIRYRTAESEVQATRWGYLLVGGGLSLIFSSLDLMTVFGMPSPGLGHLWLTFYMYFWMQVVLRSRLLDLKDFVGKALSLLILAGLISLIYAALLIWVESSLGLFFFNTVAASALLVVIFEPVKRMVDLWVGRLLFRDTYDLEIAIRKLRSELMTAISLDDVVERVVHRLYSSRRFTHASVFFLESGGRAYSLPLPEAAHGQLREERIDVVQGRSFLDALARERMLLLEQVERELFYIGEDAEGSPERARLEDIRRIMSLLSASISFAFTSGDRLLGFLNVRDDRSSEAFSTYELGLIGDLTAHITTSIENSELVRQLKERDRLSALGEMATGMAHEIRNPLGAVKSAAQLLGPTNVDAESTDLLRVIVEETNRLDLVLTQFLHFARPYQGELGPVQAKDVLDRVATLIRTQEREPAIAVHVEYPASLPKVVADADQLHQVCLNLSLNACQAMEENGGTLTIAASLVVEDRPGRPGHNRRRVEITVSDDGPGMSEEVKLNLFIPFFTTKRTGTGLGLPISQRLLQHHGSEIRVDSAPGQGTKMSFLLFLVDDIEQLTGEHRRLLTTGGP